VVLRAHPTKFYDSNLSSIADELRVPRADVGQVLDEWTNAQLVAHLEQFPAEVLDTPAAQRLFLTYGAGS
jgi:hypothetical protein